MFSVLGSAFLIRLAFVASLFVWPVLFRRQYKEISAMRMRRIETLLGSIAAQVQEIQGELQQYGPSGYSIAFSIIMRAVQRNNAKLLAQIKGPNCKERRVIMAVFVETGSRNLLDYADFRYSVLVRGRLPDFLSFNMEILENRLQSIALLLSISAQNRLPMGFRLDGVWDNLKQQD